MYIPQGKIVAVQIIVAVIAQGMGGFLLNQNTVTSCESQFDYSTDVFGAFTGDGQDIPVDFNPRENVTGYYAMDPTDPGTGQEQKRQPAIYYDPPNPPTPNNYPYQRQAQVSATYTLTVECTKALDDYTHPETYKVTVKQQTEEGPVEHEYTWQGGNMTKYSGLYKTSVGYITHSYIYINGVLHEAPRILNIYDLMSHTNELKDKDLSLVLKNGGSYPTFLANLDYTADVGLFHRSYEFYYNSEVSTYAYVETGTATTEIHIQKYNVSDSWLVFGSEHDGDNKITLTVIAFEPDKESIYIDPNKGVAPAHQSTSYTEWHDEYYHPYMVGGSIIGYGAAIPGDDGEYSFKTTVKSASDAEHPESSKESNLFDMKVKWYIVGSGPGAHPELKFTIAVPGYSTVEEIFDMTGYSPELNYSITWTIENKTLTIKEWVGESSKEKTHTFNLTDLDQYIVYQSLGSHVIDNGQMSGVLRVYDAYDPVRTPDEAVTPEVGFNIDRSVAVATYQVEHIPEEIPFDSDQTYWYNGYNNSTVGMIVSCLPIPGTSGDVPAETKFNVMLHMTDLTDRWCYNDVLKPAISVWTDENTGMVYVGRYNSDGIRMDGSAMQVGVCSYAYFELRVVNGALTLWIAPVYQFQKDAPFMDFTPEPLFDQTAAIMGVAPTGSSVKSITQLSYNVQTIQTAVQNNVQTVTQPQQDIPATVGTQTSEEDEVTWVSGDCVVHAYANPNRFEVTGNGAMADYASQDDVPWKDYNAWVVVIQDGVTHIGDYAFRNFTGVQFIDGRSAGGQLVEPISVTSIGKNAFNGLYQLKRVVFTDKLTSIGSDAFYGCSALASVTIPNSVTSIGGSAFSHCTSLASVTIGNSVETIGDHAFDNCKSLESVTIPDSVTTVGDSAFSHCTSLASVTIGNSVETIGDHAFDNCKSLESVTIPDSVTSIGSFAFYLCRSLTTIAFKAGEWNITLGNSAFELNVPDGNTHADVYSYNNCAEDKLGTYPAVTFTYHSMLMPVYPRQLVTHTVILLDGGGLYKENGELSLNKSFPNDALTEVVINAVVHPGDSMSLITHKEIEGETVEVEMVNLKNDGVDKWIYKDQYYNWWEIQIFYVSNHIGDVDIDGHHYSGGMYLEDGTKLDANHVYLHIGKYGLYEDLGDMGIADGRSDLTIRMNGIWAFSTQYYLGTNVQGSKIAFEDAGIWHWSWNEALVVFAMVMLAVSVVLFYKFGFNIYDILFMGGALALLWVSFQG